MRENPDTLYCDKTLQSGEKYKTDLIFYSTQISVWKSEICDQFKHFNKDDIDCGERIIIFYDEKRDTNHPVLTISCYNTGIILVQGNDMYLSSFENKFSELKATVFKNRTNTNTINLAESTQPQPSTSNIQLKDEKERAEETVAEETSSVNELTESFSKLS